MLQALQAILRLNPLILATSLALLLFALILVVRRRWQLNRMRRQRLKELAEDVPRESVFAPLAQLASSVEVLDLDDLLAGEDDPAAAVARRQLEAPTDILTDADSFFPPSRSIAQPTRAPSETVPARSVSAPVAPAPAAPQPEAAPPVRELALAWFEARGYRPSKASQAVRPIELVLRHREDPTRAYAFISERGRLSAERVGALVEHAKSIGLSKVLIASEAAIGSDLQSRFRRAGVRLVDNDEMRREFDKVGLRVAAKIIAVARSRARLAKAAR